MIMPLSCHLRCTSIGIILLSLGGCGVSKTPSDVAIATFSLTSRAGITDYAIDPSPLKRAAAGYYRAVAFESQTSTAVDLAERIRIANYAEKGIHGSLDRQTKTRIESRLTNLDRAMINRDRTGVAMESLEIYRLLLEDVAVAGKVPVGVSLIDYAGLASQVDLLSATPDWSSMNHTLKLAKSSWNDVAEQVDEAPVKAKFSATLDDWNAAVKRQDAVAARQVLAAIENQISQLQTYFENT